MTLTMMVMTTKMPSRSWTKVPVFCSGEKHEIWWDEVGRLWLPHHTSIDTAAVEAKLMKSKQLPDELCYVFAGAVRGSKLCQEVLEKAAAYLAPELKAHVAKILLKREARKHANGIVISFAERAHNIIEYRHPDILARCELLFNKTTLGMDTKEDADLRGYNAQRVVHVGSCEGKPSFRVQMARVRNPETRKDDHMLVLWVTINPKSWAGLYLKNKVILEDPNTSHPSGCAFALAPGPDPVSFYCIRYKRASYGTAELPRTLELGLERVRLTENGWAICERRTYL